MSTYYRNMSLLFAKNFFSNLEHICSVHLIDGKFTFQILCVYFCPMYVCFLIKINEWLLIYLVVFWNFGASGCSPFSFGINCTVKIGLFRGEWNIQTVTFFDVMFHELRRNELFFSKSLWLKVSLIF